jgi:lysyl-tRNA synthetase class 2
LRPPDRRQQRRWVPFVAGLLALVLGLVEIVEGMLPGLARHYKLHRTAEVVPGTVVFSTRTADVVIGLLLLMLSHGLRRRKHRAWQAVILLLATSVAVHILRDHHFGTIAVTIVLLGALAFYHREFYAVGDPGTRWRALATLVGLVIADVVIGLTFIALSRDLFSDYTIAQRVQSVVWSLAGANGPVRFTDDGRGDLFHFLTTGLGFFTLIMTGYLFLRTARQSGRLTSKDALQIRELLDRHGEQDSLGYFALRNDKTVIWSPNGKACIGYRVMAGVMLASGDPIGDPETWPGAIHAFLDEASRHAWVPAVVGCGELGAEIWCREGGLTALELGDEAVVEIANFSLQGRSMRNVRQMVARVCRHGYVAEVRRIADVPREEITRLLRQADSWRGSPTERGFSMALGRVGGKDDGGCVIATATEDGVLRAILHFVPWGSDGLSLDVMRRDRSAQPGLNDFLIVEAIKNANQLGVKRISLNFAVFRAALERGERIGAGPVLRAWRRVLLFASRWFQIESLYKFNAKFSPEWVPRFLLYPSTGDLPRIGLAALEAEAFLVWPNIGPRRLAHQLGLYRLGSRWRRSGRRPRPAA